MSNKIYIYWILSLLLVAVAIYFVTKNRYSADRFSTDDSNSLIRETGPRQSMENDNKWTRCFQMGDGTIFFEDHRISKDGGKTVTTQDDIDVEAVNGAPERAVLVRGDLFYALDGPTKMVTPGIYAGKAWRSSDGLKTIEEERVVFNVPDGPGRDGVNGEWYGIYVYRTILEMPDGTWLMTMYGNFTSDTIVPFDADARKELTTMQRTIIVTSGDQGHTWDFLSTVASPKPGDPVGEGFVEPAITLLKDGRLLCVMRSGHHFPLYASWSEDGGRTWSPPLYTGLDRGCDPCLITLEDGRVALSWGRRFPEGWSQVTPEGDKGHFEYPGAGYTNLSISDDGGVSWVTHKIMERSGSCYSTILEVESNVLFMLVDQWYCRITLKENPKGDTVRVVQDIAFAETINHKGEPVKLLLDVYMPGNTTGPKRKVMVWVHGGGFKGGDRRQGYIVTLSRAFAARGYVCIAPDYRLREDPGKDYQGTIDDAVSDIHLALKWVTAHGKKYDYDSKEMIVGGGSAGGILLSNLCFRKEKEKHNRKIRAFINLWGSPDNEKLFAGIEGGDPPTLIIHGDRDQSVPYKNSEMLSAGLQNAGVYYELHTFSGAGHTPIDQMDRIIDLITGFLNRPETNILESRN
ncbi:MAG: exo-alpha-sialidase [Bacteroidales bacterium]